MPNVKIKPGPATVELSLSEREALVLYNILFHAVPWDEQTEAERLSEAVCDQLDGKFAERDLTFEDSVLSDQISIEIAEYVEGQK